MPVEAAIFENKTLLKRFKALFPVVLVAGVAMVARQLVAGAETGPHALSMEEFMKFLHMQGFTLNAEGQIVPLDGASPEHPGFAGDNRGGGIYEDPGVDATEGSADFLHNIESGAVTEHDFNDMLQYLKSQEDRAQWLLKQYLLLTPPGDPNAKLAQSLADNFKSLHDQLSKLGDDFHDLDAARRVGGQTYAEALAKLKSDMADIRSPDGGKLSESHLDSLKGKSNYEASFLKEGVPGQVIYSDPSSRNPVPEWRYLNDIPHVDITYKEGVQDQLDLMTAGRFYWYYRVLAMHGELIGSNVLPHIEITEGYGLTTKHNSMAHPLGLAMDFVPKNGNFSPESIARYLYWAHEVPGASVFFENPNLSDVELDQFRKNVVSALTNKYHMSASSAHALVFGNGSPHSAHVISSGTGKHLHFEIVGPGRTGDRTLALER